MIVVSVTSPLNDLVLTDSIRILTAIFGRVYAPSAVVTELSHPRAPQAVRNWANNPPNWLEVRDPEHIDSSVQRGDGETAAISLALEIGANLLRIEERKGYTTAQRRGLKVTTTLCILEEAYHRGLIDFEQTIERLERETTFCVAANVLEEFRRRIREWKLAREQRAPDQIAEKYEEVSRKEKGDIANIESCAALRHYLTFVDKCSVALFSPAPCETKKREMSAAGFSGGTVVDQFKW